MKWHRKIWVFCKKNVFTIQGRFQRWTPVVVVLMTTVLAFLIFSFQQFEIVTKPYFRKQLDLIIVSFFIIMYLWSFLRVVFERNKKIPDEYKFPPSICNAYDISITPIDLEDAARDLVINNNLPIQNRLINGNFRYCHRCMIVKPDRTHHCSSCNQCIVKFDHHCPWVNNCVMFTNYKYFLLFLFYGTLLHSSLAINNIESVVDYVTNKNEVKYRHVDGIIIVCFAINFFLNFGSLLATLGMLLWHLTLVGRNLTTNESYRSPIFAFGADKKAYNISVRYNFGEVFGSRKLLWFVPVWTSKGDGFVFKQRKYSKKNKYNNDREKNTSSDTSTSNSSFHTPTSTYEDSKKSVENSNKISEEVMVTDTDETQSSSSYRESFDGKSSINESVNVINEENKEIENKL